MRLFLCSYFEKVGGLLKEEAAGKNIVFVPTASVYDEYKDHVPAARRLWEEMGAKVIEVEISTAPLEKIQQTFEQSDIIYFTGGNTFFLMDHLRRTGTDALIKAHVERGKLYVGESGGAIVCAPELSYIRPMDEVPAAFSQPDYAGLGLIDFYVVPHYMCSPFKECTQQILEEYAALDLCALHNLEAVVVEDGKKRIVRV